MGVLRAPQEVCRRGRECRAVKASPSQPAPWGRSVLPGQSRPVPGPRPEVPSSPTALGPRSGKAPAAQQGKLASAAPAPQTHTHWNVLAAGER